MYKGDKKVIIDPEEKLRANKKAMNFKTVCVLAGKTALLDRSFITLLCTWC